MGDCAYTLVRDLDTDWSFGSIVEVGSERGEGSTAFFEEFAKQKGTPFFSVDMDIAPHEAAKAICGARAYRMTGERFFAEEFHKFGLNIHFLYLDNFDWSWGGDEGKQIQDAQSVDYTRNGLVLNNANSQLAHCVQAALATQFMPKGYILFDDTWKDGDQWTGKGGTAVPMLLNRGFVVARAMGMHVLLQKR
jgi:hypothetical protein